MDVDHLYTLSSEELDALLQSEVEKIIQSAAPEKRDRLRAFQNGIRLQVQASKNPTDAMIRTNRLMMDKNVELINSVRELRPWAK